MEILVLLCIEAANVFGEPASCDVDELCAAEIEVDCGSEDGFEGRELEFDFLLLLFKAFDELALGFSSDCGEVLTQTLGVGSAIVGVEEIGMNVGVAYGAGCAAYFAERTLEGFGFFLDAADAGGENEQFEGGFDAAGGGAKVMDAFRRGFFEACGHGCLEHQALAEKHGDGLRHHFYLLLQMRYRVA